MCAGAILAALPGGIFMILAQKYPISGLTQDAITTWPGGWLGDTDARAAPILRPLGDHRVVKDHSLRHSVTHKDRLTPGKVCGDIVVFDGRSRVAPACQLFNGHAAAEPPRKEPRGYLHRIRPVAVTRRPTLLTA
jgi:hypothetical protein